MASVYVSPNGGKLSYMDFYMSLNDSVLPEKCDINVVPMKIKPYPGFTIKEDTQVIKETLSMGMPLMTTDKVLNKIMENLKHERS